MCSAGVGAVWRFRAPTYTSISADADNIPNAAYFDAATNKGTSATGASVMPISTMPLVGSPTARGFAKSVGTSSKDQQYINCLFEVGQNPQLGSKSVWVNKRPGSTTDSSIGSGVQVLTSYSSYFSQMFATQTAIFADTTNIGTISTGVRRLQLSDTVSGNQDLIGFADGGGSAYYCFKDAVTTNFPTFSGDTHTNTTIENIASTTGLYPGQLITGTGIQAGTRIATITSATAITTTLATTGSATITITKEAIAKVIDSDLPSSCIAVVANGGYLFFGFADGRIFNSDINQPWVVGAASVVSADFSADSLSDLSKFGETIIAFGSASRQYFSITGNTSGSVLSVNRAGNIYDDVTYVGPIFRSGVGYAIGAKANTGYGLFRFTSPGEITNVAGAVVGGIMDQLAMAQIGTAWFSRTKIVIPLMSASSTISLVYDPENSMFSEFLCDANITSSWNRFFTKAGSSTRFLWASGNTWTDSGAAYTMTIQTEPFVLNNGRPFWIDAIELLADTQASGTTSVTTYADDYATAKTLSPFDMTATNKIIRRCGYYKNHVAIRLEHNANTAWRGQALKIHWRPASL